MPESIYDLFAKVREHPDFAGGTIWTREDVADALNFYAEDYDGSDPTTEQIAAVTPEQMHRAENILEAFVFEGAYSWREALGDNLTQHV